MTRPYTGRPYSPEQVRALYVEETPERMVQHALAGRRTVADAEAVESSALPSTPIIQPEWTSQFYRLMSDDIEMSKMKNWWHYPTRRALARLAYIPWDWGLKRVARRRLIQRCMTLYLRSNYDIAQIAAVTGIYEHEAYRALVEAAAVMTRDIGVFGEEFRAYDRHAFVAGLGR